MVITNVNQVVYRGDGVTTAFPFTFRIIDATDIKLLLIDADGTKTDIQSDYFVDTVNNTVHYPGYAPGAEPPGTDQPAPVQTGQRLVIYRELPITQEKNLGDKWPFFVIELALDKLTMILQQIYGWWGRTLKFGVGWQIDHPGFDTTIPVEAGKTWRVNDEGTGFVATGDPDEAVVVANNAKDVADAAALVAAGAKTTAEGIAATAQEAKNIAQDAKAVADDAKTTAEGIAATAQEAKDIAQDAKAVADDAKTTAEGIAATAQEAKDIAQDAKAVADDAKDVADGIAEETQGLISKAEYGFLKRNKRYAVGDIAYTTQLPAGYYLECVTAGTTGNTEPTISVESENVNDGTVKWGVKNIQDASKSGLPVGFEAFTTNPTLQAGWLPLLGGEYSRTTYADLWAWVQTQNGYLIEESAWQAKAAANGGNVPFYSKGDGSTTFRVPALKCWVRGANSISEVGGYLAAGLPNITGMLQLRNGDNVGFEINNINGAFSAADSTRVTKYVDSYDSGQALFAPRLKFSAHDSSSIYGNSTTVQPESIVGMWLVKAYGTVTNVGSTDVANISTGLTQAETRISALENHGAGATVVESYRNGTEWYRVWSDGWVEQGGIVSSMPTGNNNNTTNYSIITLPKAFADTKYVVSVMVNSLTQTNAIDTIVTLNEKNTTNFKTRNFDSGNALQVSASWFACGQGA